MRLVDFLSVEPKYEEFQNDSLHFFGGTGAAVNPRDLAAWLIHRATDTNPEAAKNDLSRYLEATNFGALQIATIVGLHVDFETPQQIGPSVLLASPKHVGNLQIARRFPWWDQGYDKVTAIAYKSVELPKYVLTQEEDRATPLLEKFKIPSAQDVLDALNCFGTTSFRGLSVTGWSIVVDDWVPLGGHGFGTYLLPHRGNTSGPSVIECETSRGLSKAQKFAKLSDGNKRKLRLSMQKLNEYLGHDSLENRAISLRTCLESLFLESDEKTEMSYRLALRAALFNEANLEERKSVRKTLKQAYELSSKAVHGSKIQSSKPSEIEKIKSLDQAAKIAQKTILALIECPINNWAEFELTGQFQSDQS